MTVPSWWNDFTEPNVCLGENLTTDDAGQLRLEPWALPRLVADVRALSAGDGKLYPTIALPGKLLIDSTVSWRNDAPIEQTILIRVTRASRWWLTSNPNAIQFRDRWTTAVDAEPSLPVTSGIYNSQVGSAVDIGTNSVAEPEPGLQWRWADANSSDDWFGPLAPGSELRVHYRCYVWTPPPWSDNANKGDPQHEAWAQWTRVQIVALGQQGSRVVG